jgi:hypothetical protein
VRVLEQAPSRLKVLRARKCQHTLSAIQIQQTIERKGRQVRELMLSLSCYPAGWLAHIFSPLSNRRCSFSFSRSQCVLSHRGAYISQGTLGVYCKDIQRTLSEALKNTRIANAGGLCAPAVITQQRARRRRQLKRSRAYILRIIPTCSTAPKLPPPPPHACCCDAFDEGGSLPNIVRERRYYADESSDKNERSDSLFLPGGLEKIGAAFRDLCAALTRIKRVGV